mgnify:CR=1 FL=1
MFLALLVSSAMAAPSGKVMLYSSMQEDQLVAIKKGFEAKYPEIVMDYYFAGTGRVITKIATEHQAGQVAADVIWVGDPSDYLSFKKEGILEKYSSPEASAIASKFIDPDGFYTGARMMNMGIGYNSALVEPQDAPKSWNDLLDPKWEGQIVMTDPASAGTTKYFVAALLASPKYGEEYFKKLRAIYKEKCDLMCGYIDNEFSKKINYTKPQGGLFVWCDLPESCDMNDFCRKAVQEYKIAVVPGNSFSIEEGEVSHSFRLNYSTPTNEQIKKGMEILARMTREMLD